MAKGSKVLVIDDQLGIRKLLEEAISANGYDVLTLGKSIESITTIKNFQPEVILLDVKMPEMNGLDVIEAMTKEKIDIPIVLMTAYGELELVEDAKRMGVKHFLTKPFDILEMHELLNEILAKIPA